MTFETYVLLAIICGILTIIFLFIAVIKMIKEGAEKSAISTAIGALFSAIFAVISYINITIPPPVILPLDNDTKTYIDNLEIIIQSESSNFLETYYTLDGTDPKNGEIYIDKINISESTTVCARNKFLWKWSEIAKNPYIVEKNDKDTFQHFVRVTNKSNLVKEILNISSLSHQNINIQKYPDDYIIVWEDDTFEKYMKDIFHKNDITYADVRNIKSLYILENEMVIDKHLDNIDVLSVSEPDFICLNDLKYFEALNELYIFHFKSFDCSIFENSTYVTKLNSLTICAELQSFQIEQIIKLKNLSELHIYGYNINKIDLEKISTVNSIKKLGLVACNIEDISPIGNMIQLKHLDLSYNKINNIDVLKELYNLESVYLFNNTITDYTPVSHVNIVVKNIDELY